MAKKTRVLIVDDSALVRHTLSRILNSDKEIEVVDTASDPIFAIQKIKSLNPDVITLDIEMPRMDGLTFLRKLMKQHPIPVVIISSYAREGSNTAMKALEYGALDAIQKPELTNKSKLDESAVRICESVKAASHAKLHEHHRLIGLNKIPEKKPEKKHLPFLPKSSNRIVLIGASTGGTEAIKLILQSLPDNFPATLIVQHMPEGFTRSFAERLDQISQMHVVEASDNEKLCYGKAIVAHGNKHMLLKKSHKGFYVELFNGPLVNRHRPSVDVLFNSAASLLNSNAIAVILTGMGKDGAAGIKNLYLNRVTTIAQDENSSVVFGMPREAINLGGVSKVLPLSQIASFMIKKFKSNNEL